MEWSKTAISRAELEKKQREYMEVALSMARRAERRTEEETPPQILTKEEIVEEIVEKTDDLSGLLDEIKEKSEEADTEQEEIIEKTENSNTDNNEQFGVFDTKELVEAIESGEVSGEGLKQAAEILEEMTRKTETMKKLVEEQETEDIYDNGEDYGLNGFINRHNNNCRGCGNEHGFKAT